MDRVAAFVDAGYLFAQGSVLLAGRRLTRGEVQLDHEAVVRMLSAFSESVSKVPLLRIYWYDGTSTGPTPQHLTLAHLANVKVRLGFVNSVGEQKGVDSLIVTDMIALARNRAISDAVLISGDEDLRVGVQQAQEFGVRVHLVGIKPSRGSQSLFLLQESDTTHEWSEHEIAGFLTVREPAGTAGALALTPAPTPPAVAGDPLGDIALEIAESIDPSELLAVLEAYESSRQVPRELDRQLLAGGRTRLGRDLLPEDKKRVRAAFLERARRRHSGTD
jgi:NYN domain